jgi:hypothetical protein
MLKTSKGPPIDMSALDSGQSPQSVDMKAIFGQLVLDALRQLIREEIDAALKSAGPAAATKKATRYTRREQDPPRPSRHPVGPRSLDVVRG